MINYLFRPVFDMLTPEDIKDASVEMQRQYLVVVSLILISTFFLVTLGIVTTIQGATQLAVMDFSIAATFVGLGVVLKETGKIKEISTVIISFLAIYFYYLFFYSGLEHSTWVWYYTFPLWSIFLLGKKNGTSLSLFLLGSTMATHLFLATATDMEMHSTNMLIRFVASYLCVVFITFVMEDTRVVTHRKLIKANESLNAMVDELNTARGELHELSIRDSLTGLYNRRHFDEVLTRSIAQSKRYSGSMALIFIDVDYFKTYNEEYGKPSGDMALRQIAKAISSVIRREADTICRFGGEEFAVILHNCQPGKVERISENILRTITHLDIPHKRSPFNRLTASLGAITLPSQDAKVTPVELQKSADYQLYLAKKQGRNRISVKDFVDAPQELEPVFS